MAKQQPEKHDGKAGVLFVACLFLGMGIGWLLDNAGPGTIIGLGAGFLAMFMVKRK
jgi:F0F1-type ATP synthase assembly protein I